MSENSEMARRLRLRQKSKKEAGRNEHFIADPLPRVGVGTMIVRNGKVLLGRRRGSHGAETYGWTGGHLQFGESLETCAIREAREEANLEIRNLRLLTVSNIATEDWHYVDFQFVTEDIVGDPIVREPEKVHGWNWYRLDALPSPLFLPVRLAIESYPGALKYYPGGR